MEGLKKTVEKYHMEKWFQKENLIVLILLGLLLVVIGLPIEDERQQADVGRTVVSEASAQETEGGLPAETSYDSLYAYADHLEEKLEDILQNMSGVGRVQVMITLEASEELVVEKDEPFTRNNTTEEDGDGGSRTVYQMDSGQETVYEKSGSNETPYVTKTILPKISGILIVAEGAGTGAVSKNISEIAQTLFDVEAHKVQVVPFGEP